MIWTNAGAIVIDDAGHVILCDDCPCDDAGAGSCCNGTIPTTLIATWQNDGSSVALIYNPSTDTWRGAATANCGPDFDVTAWCSSENGNPCWFYEVGVGFAGQSTGCVAYDCDPFSADSLPIPLCGPDDVLEFREP